MPSAECGCSWGSYEEEEESRKKKKKKNYTVKNEESEDNGNTNELIIGFENNILRSVDS